MKIKCQIINKDVNVQYTFKKAPAEGAKEKLTSFRCDSKDNCGNYNYNNCPYAEKYR